MTWILIYIAMTQMGPMLVDDGGFWQDLDECLEVAEAVNDDKSDPRTALCATYRGMEEKATQPEGSKSI